jgi:hypothetical protein
MWFLVDSSVVFSLRASFGTESFLVGAWFCTF